MPSNTKITELKRKRKKSNLGKARKKAQSKQSTPAFSVHVEKDVLVPFEIGHLFKGRRSLHGPRAKKGGKSEARREARAFQGPLPRRWPAFSRAHRPPRPRRRSPRSFLWKREGSSSTLYRLLLRPLRPDGAEG